MVFMDQDEDKAQVADDGGAVPDLLPSLRTAALADTQDWSRGSYAASARKSGTLQIFIPDETRVGDTVFIFLRYQQLKFFLDCVSIPLPLLLHIAQPSVSLCFHAAVRMASFLLTLIGGREAPNASRPAIANESASQNRIVSKATVIIAAVSVESTKKERKKGRAEISQRFW